MKIMDQRAVMVQAHGKINLTLDVVGKRNDGYHDILSIMQSISLHDRMRLSLTGTDISVACSHPEVPANEENLVFRAAQELRRVTRVKAGVHIQLSKGIPVAAGLGGGSADAAAVLLGLNKLWNTGLSQDQLREIGQSLGADVPFCLMGGTALAEGIGERLTPLPALPQQWLVLVKPPFGVSTSEIYEAYDSAAIPVRPDTAAVLRSIRRGDFSGAVAGAGNVLEQVTASLYPEVAEIVASLKTKGAKKVFMCGSGPTVCAFVENRPAAENLKKQYPGYPGKIHIANTTARGNMFLVRLRRGEKCGRKETFTNTAGKL